MAVGCFEGSDFECWVVINCYNAQKHNQRRIRCRLQQIRSRWWKLQTHQSTKQRFPLIPQRVKLQTPQPILHRKYSSHLTKTSGRASSLRSLKTTWWSQSKTPMISRNSRPIHLTLRWNCCLSVFRNSSTKSLLSSKDCSQVWLCFTASLSTCQFL